MDDIDNVKLTSKEWDEYWDDYMDDIKYYHDKEWVKEQLAEIKRYGGKRKIKSIWRKMNKEWTDNQEAITKKLTDERLDKSAKELSNDSKILKEYENLLKKHEDEFEKVKGRIDKVRVDVN